MLKHCHSHGIQMEFFTLGFSLGSAPVDAGIWGLNEQLKINIYFLEDQCHGVADTHLHCWHSIQALVHAPAAVLLIQFPANGLRKATEDDPHIGASVAHMEDPDENSRPWLWQSVGRCRDWGNKAHSLSKQIYKSLKKKKISWAQYSVSIG